MPTRTKKKWKTDNRGRYSRELGYKRNASDNLVPHKFYLGTDLTEAKRRNACLEKLWEVIESEHEKLDWPMEWSDLTLMIGREIDTYTIDELKLLNEYATPLERLLLLVALNCGFGSAEQGRVTLGDVFLHQAHPHSELLASLQGYQSDSHDSFLCMARPKTGIYGEWKLWPQTVQAIEWGRQRRERIGDATPDAVLLVTDRGTPFLKQTTGGNRGQNFNRRWADLTKGVKADYPDFSRRSFGKLRKTAGNLVRQFSDGEIAGVFLCHGSPVKSDDLIDLYTNRPFAKVFEVLRELEDRLKPVFDAAPDDLFAQPMQQYTGLKKSKRIMQLHDEGKTVRQIADAVGLSKTTIHRHIANHRQSE